jgi:hypothetical protein
MFDINCVISYGPGADGAVKDGDVRSWSDLDKRDVIEFETAFNRAMTKMGKMAADTARGRARKIVGTNKTEMRMEITITEDGVKWLRATYEWPNMGEEQQALLLGTIDGELSTLPDELRGTARYNSSGKKK